MTPSRRIIGHCEPRGAITAGTVGRSVVGDRLCSLLRPCTLGVALYAGEAGSKGVHSVRKLLTR